MPVFVLTHRPHDVVAKGGTTFTFVTDGIECAVAQAGAAAGDKKVHVMGVKPRPARAWSRSFTTSRCSAPRPSTSAAPSRAARSARLMQLDG
jgi:hypothetical protein